MRNASDRSQGTRKAGRAVAWRWRVLSLFVAGAVAVLFCETIARFLFAAPPYPFREPSLVFIRDSELSYLQKPNQVGWIDDGKASINSLGLRGPNLTHPKPESVYRILAIGDSITFGWGVNDDETFCHQLEESLKKRLGSSQVEVINGGVSGYATNQERALLARFAPQVQPDLVLIGFYWNDLLMSDSSANPGVRRTDGTTQISTQPMLTRDELNMTGSGAWWDRLLRRSRAGFVAGRAVKRLLGAGEWNAPYTSLEVDLLEGDESEEIKKRWLRFESEISKVATLADQFGFKVGIVVLPSRQQVAGDFPAARIQSKVREIAKRNHLFVIDPLPAFQNRREDIDTLYIAYDRHHPSATGHLIIADCIAEDLRTNDRLREMVSLSGRTHK